MSATKWPIDQEWAQSLIVICLQVPQSWCPGYSGSELYNGAVRDLDFSYERIRYFLFEDDDDIGSRYPMQYDAVLHYAGKEQRGYARFRLPPNLPANLTNEAVYVVRSNAQQRRQQRWQRLFPTNNNLLPNSNHPHHCRRHGRRNNNMDDTSTSTTVSRTVDTSEDGTSDKEEEGQHPTTTTG